MSQSSVVIADVQQTFRGHSQITLRLKGEEDWFKEFLTGQSQEFSLFWGEGF